MSKSDTINVRIEPELKKQAEEILEKLGISASTAINMYYRQIVEKNGIPMELSLNNSPNIPVYEDLSEEELSRMITESHKQYLEGDYMALEDALRELNTKHGFEELNDKYGL